MAGKADFYADGEWNGYCDFCGAKVKSSDVMRTWNNFYVCKHHRELRNPQDFVRGVRENQSLPWTRPQPPELFTPINWTRSVSDTVRVQEALFNSYSIGTFAEGINVFESVRVGQTEVQEEVLTTAESISFGLHKNFTESINADEFLSLSVGKELSDGVEVAEILALDVGKGISEEVSVGETVTLQLNIYDPALLNGDLLNSQLLN